MPHTPCSKFTFPNKVLCFVNSFISCYTEQTFLKIVSEYDQEIQQSQTADNLMAPRGRVTRHQEDKLSKATSSLFPIKMIAILEWT